MIQIPDVSKYTNVYDIEERRPDPNSAQIKGYARPTRKRRLSST